MTLSFDGHDLETIGMCGDPSFDWAGFAPDIEEMESSNGGKLIGQRIQSGTVTFHIAVFGATAEARRVKLSTLAAWLDVDEPKRLVLPDTPNWYYLAVPSAGFAIDANINPYMFELAFTLTDPIAYGITERTVTVPYGGSVTFTVGGTAPTYPYFGRVLQKPDSTTKQWGLQLDSNEQFVLDFGTTSNRYVQADFGKRVSYVADSLKLPTLNSDWFALTPGEHTITNHIGTGSDTKIKWHERWH